MNQQEANKALAREFLDALSALDTDGFLATMTDDVFFETPGHHQAAGVKTKAQVAQEMPPMREVLPQGIKFTILTMTAEDDRVHVELAGEAKTADGSDYNNRYHYAFVIRGNKICSFRDYMDSDLVVRILVPAFVRHGAVMADREREAARAMKR